MEEYQYQDREERIHLLVKKTGYVCRHIRRCGEVFISTAGTIISREIDSGIFVELCRHGWRNLEMYTQNYVSSGLKPCELRSTVNLVALVEVAFFCKYQGLTTSPLFHKSP